MDKFEAFDVWLDKRLCEMEAIGLDEAFYAGWQSRQAEVDELSQENTRLKYLVGEKIGHPSARDLLDAEVQRQLEEQKQSENREFLTDEDIENLIKGVLKDHDENPDKYWINIYKQVDDLQIAIKEKDKRIEELESRLKAVHALARMRSAVINADRWFTLRPHIKNAIKCLDRKEKALRGEHE